MKVLLILISLFCFVASSYGYEKWEQIASNKGDVCYLDEGNVSKMSDTEYSLTLRFEYKKPILITVTQTTLQKGKPVTQKVKRKASSEVYNAVLDTAKQKIYVQSSYFLVENERVNRPVSPSDVFEASTGIYEGVYASVKAKFKAPDEEANTTDQYDGTITEGVKKFFELSKAGGMAGAAIFVNSCYDVSSKGDANSMVFCASVDTAAMRWDAFVSKQYKFPPNEFFAAENVKSRISHALDVKGIEVDARPKIVDGLMSRIYQGYQDEMLRKSQEPTDDEDNAIPASDEGEGAKK